MMTKSAWRFNQLRYNLGLENLTDEYWSVYVKQGTRYDEYHLCMETETEICPPVIYTEDELENLATFCRGFLTAWEHVLKQGIKND